MKKISITIISTVIIVAAILSTHYINLGSVVSVKVCGIQQTGIVSSVTSKGKVEEAVKKEVFVDIPARIQAVNVKEGEYVQNGQTIIELDISDLKLQLEQAQANVEIEKLNLQQVANQVQYYDEFQREDNRQIYGQEKTQKVWNETQIPAFTQKNNIALQKKKLEIAQLQVEELEKKIESQPTIITSPIQGVVTYLNAKEGAITNSVQPIVAISGLDKLQIKADIGEYYISDIRKGQKVEITGDAFEGITYEGVVSYIAPVAKQLIVGQSKDTVIEVIIDVLAQNTVLKPGYSANIKIITRTKGDVIIIPYEAVLQDENNQDIVYIYKDGRAFKRKIALGAELELEVEVIKGLKKGEQVILNPSKHIKDGVRVKK